MAPSFFAPLNDLHVEHARTRGSVNAYRGPLPIRCVRASGAAVYDGSATHWGKTSLHSTAGQDLCGSCRRLMSQVSSIVITWAAAFWRPFLFAGCVPKAPFDPWPCSARPLLQKRGLPVLLVWPAMGLTGWPHLAVVFGLWACPDEGFGAGAVFLWGTSVFHLYP